MEIISSPLVCKGSSLTGIEGPSQKSAEDAAWPPNTGSVMPKSGLFVP